MRPTEPLLSPRVSHAASSEAAVQLNAAGESVEVVTITTDHELLGTLRGAVSGEQRRVWHAPGYQEAAELIMAGRVGVAIIDTATTGAETSGLCEKFRSQFPDLTLIVAGTVKDQTHLVAQITSGEIYRFLHKPISEARAHQFIETSVRRHLGLSTGAYNAYPPRRPRKPLWAIASVAVALITAIALWIAHDDDPPEPLDEATAVVSTPTLQLAPPAAIESPSATTPPPATKMVPATNFARTSKAVVAAQTSEPVADASNSATEEAPPAAAVAAETLPPAEASTATTEAPPPPAAETQVASTETKIEPTTEITAEKPAEVLQPTAPAPDPKAAFLANVVAAASLERTRQTEPAYPYRARRDGTEGWVELDFTVDARGQVKDIEVHAADPLGVFDKSAADALAQWRFKPVMKDGRAVDQRARVRLRFQMEK